MAQEHKEGPVVWVLAASPTGAPDTDWLPAPDRVIVADGGANIATDFGLLPDLVIGDFDSSDASLIAKWRAQGIETRAYDHHTKLETDTELAVLAALEWNPRQIYILGATGGRLDHTLANILLLTDDRLREHDVRIIERRQEIYLARTRVPNMIEARPGDRVTLLPIGGDVTDVWLRDFRYPLNGETLPIGRGRGVSNEVAGVSPTVRFESGLLLVVVDHGVGR